VAYQELAMTVAAIGDTRRGARPERASVGWERLARRTETGWWDGAIKRDIGDLHVTGGDLNGAATYRHRQHRPPVAASLFMARQRVCQSRNSPTISYASPEARARFAAWTVIASAG
jgi:hypothetical protein